MSTRFRASPGKTTRLRLRHGRLLFAIGKYTIFGLLLLNMVIFFAMSSLNKTIDSFGWLILLGVFEYESMTLGAAYGRWEKRLLVLAQLAGYGLAIQAAVGYGLTGVWLELANAVLWLAVCCTLAYDLYVPGEFGGREWHIRTAIKTLLYAGLIACALGWALRREWLDLLDATLWLLCFGLVERNILAFEEGEARPSAAAR
ncbi:hypothetical protein [Acidisoma sp. C75]